MGDPYANEFQTWRALLEGPLLPVAFVLVLWFTNMALTGWLAGRKGRGDGDWALLALVLGPIALALVILLPRRVPELE